MGSIGQSGRGMRGRTIRPYLGLQSTTHLGTSAHSFPELVEQLGIMRFGHRPRVADTFCGSGQIPFEAARLGCDVYASDLNPVACMLTWGAFHIVGGSTRAAKSWRRTQADCELVRGSVRDRQTRNRIRRQRLARKDIFTAVEARCPQTWLDGAASALTDRKQGLRRIAELVPDPKYKRYDIVIRSGVNGKQLTEADTRHRAHRWARTGPISNPRRKWRGVPNKDLDPTRGLPEA